MDWWQSLILGVVEGLTEYLPVSSTGHLILTQRVLGIESSEAADAFAVCIQSGAILAVFGIYAGHVRRMLLGLVGRDPEGLRLAVRVVAAFVPTAVIGLLLNKTIKQHLFGLWPIVGAWFVGGVVILLLAGWARDSGTRHRRALGELTIGGAGLVGLIQCLGMWPGTSRSLVTILGGLLAGLSLEAALEFSFLLGAVTLLAATAHDATKHGAEMLHAYSPTTMAVGFVAAVVAAAAAVKWMLSYLRRRGLEVFGYYRILLAAVVAALLGRG